MGILKGAFDAVIKLQSREAKLKRFGTPDLFSTIRIAPSNYFRFLEGPSHTTVHGREFVIPDFSITGSQIQTIGFDSVATTGSFKLTHGGEDTIDLDWDSTATEIRDALRDLTGLDNVTVSGSIAGQSLSIVFVGVESPVLLEFTKTLGNEIDADAVIVKSFFGQDWPGGKIRRGDKILDSLYGSLAIDEIIEMVDLGGDIIGYRVRVE